MSITTTLLPLMKDNESAPSYAAHKRYRCAFMDLSSDLKRHNDLIITPLFEDSCIICSKQDPLASTNALKLVN